MKTTIFAVMNSNGTVAHVELSEKRAENFMLVYGCKEVKKVEVDID